MADKHGMVQNPPDLEGGALVSGLGQFTDDLPPSDALHGVFVRAQVAHGLIRRIDSEAALGAPGVVGVLTGQDLAKAGINPITFWVPLLGLDNKTEVPYLRTPRPALAADRVRHIGEAVALVVARTAGEAQDAAELVEVDIEELPAVITAAPARAGNPIWEEAPTNQSHDYRQGDHAAVAVALEKAAHVVRVELRSQRVAGSPMETRAAIASFDEATGRYTLTCGSQGTMFLRKGMADALGVTPDKVRAISKDVGGGFGLKVYAYPEYVAVAAAARIVGCTIRWTATRSEALLADQGGRDSQLNATGAFDENGVLTGLLVETVANLGAYAIGIGPRLQSSVVAENIVGPYLTPAIAIHATGFFTNTIPTSPYRGAGRPETTYMLERLMDKAARQIGLDAAEIRRRNLIPHDRLPYTGPMGHVYDSGDFAAVLEAAIEAADVAGFDERRRGSARRGLYRGLGLSLFVETAGAYFVDPLDFRVTLDGMIELRATGVSTGQRHASTMIHLASQRLGIPHDRFRYIAGDSDEVPAGSPTVGSRVAQMTGSAVVKSVEAAIARGKAIVQDLIEGRPNDIGYAEGQFTVASSGEGIALLDLPKRISAAELEGRVIETKLNGVETFQSPGFSFPNGCHICEVEVDPLTGHVDLLHYVAADDCGNVLNHPVVEGQLVGGIAQGLGQALMEEVVYDDNGQLLSGSFMDYALPRAADMPRRFTVIDLPDPTPSNPLGAKGVGESGTTGSVATIVSAVEDALRPLGVTELQMPLSSGRIWEAIRSARQG
jgi:carbon-monoxide dehydrogenase large subunit